MLQVMASVGHLKTNWVFLEIVKELLNNKDIPILHIAESEILASQMTIRVRDALTYETVVEKFGDLEGDIWTTKQLYLKGRTPHMKGANFFSVGMKGAVEGTRYMLCYGDDIIGLKKAISRAERNYANQWIDNQVWPRINWQMGGRYLGIGSYWGPLDIYHYIEKEHKVKTLVFPAHDKDGYTNLLWPESQTPETLQYIRDHTPEPTYQLRYLCNPAGMSGKGFKLEWIEDNWVEWHEIPWDNIVITQGWDLAITEKDIIGTGQEVKTEPDYTSGSIVGYDSNTGIFYFFDLYLDRIVMGHDDVIESYYRKYPQTRNQGIESNQFQKLVYYQTRAKPSAPPVVDVPHYSIDKVTRILNLEPYFKTNRIKILKTLPHLQEFLEEYLAFPTEGAHDDILDSLEIAIKLNVQDVVKPLGSYLGGI